jgi:uncharacterized RDD family membrane protein YckC
VLPAGEEVPGAVVVWGDMTIDGHVNEDVVNVLGTLTIGPAAEIDGSVVAVGGSVTATSTSRVGQDLVVVGGALNAPPEFAPRGDHVMVGSAALGNTMRRIVPWFTNGLLWGRVITPGIGWVWAVVLVFLFVYLVIAFAFPKGVAMSVETLSKRPISAFFTGMLTLLLIGPVCALLAVSVIGIVVIPFLICALFAAWMLGKTAVMRWMGAGVLHEDDRESRLQAVRSLVIGFVIVTITYTIPVLGLAAWALVGMTGLGAATLTALATLRRERPVKPPKAVAPGVAPAPAFVSTPEPAPVPASSFAAPVEPAVYAAPPPFDTPGSAPHTPFTAAPGFSTAGAATATDLRSMPRATLADRFAAAALDVLLVAIAYNILPLSRMFSDDFQTFVLLLLVYDMVFWAWKGTTVGSIICNLRVIRTDGAPLQPVDAIVRALSSILSGVAAGIGFLVIGLDTNRERQGWHDKIAGTLVVKVPRDWPLP